jgi:DNA-binding NarL/FixJ family response regulator
MKKGIHHPLPPQRQGIRPKTESMASRRERFWKHRPNGAKVLKSGDVPLTSRQIEILQLVAGGFSNLEIAGHLALSVRTVEVHRYHLMLRIGARNVADVIRWALEAGVVTL